MILSGIKPMASPFGSVESSIWKSHLIHNIR